MYVITIWNRDYPKTDKRHTRGYKGYESIEDARAAWARVRKWLPRNHEMHLFDLEQRETLASYYNNPNKTEDRKDTKQQPLSTGVDKVLAAFA